MLSSSCAHAPEQHNPSCSMPLVGILLGKVILGWAKRAGPGACSGTGVIAAGTIWACLLPNSPSPIGHPILCSTAVMPQLHPSSTSWKQERESLPYSLWPSRSPSSFQSHSRPPRICYRSFPSIRIPAGSCNAFQQESAARLAAQQDQSTEPPRVVLKSHSRQTSTFTELAQIIQTGKISMGTYESKHGAGN